MKFRPMLADDCELDKLRFPLLASAKLDGIRAIVIGGVVLSRSLKPIPNRYVQERFRHLEHFDGELIMGPPNGKTVYRDTVSAVMSHDGQPDVSFYVFDHILNPSLRYVVRAEAVQCFEEEGVIPHKQFSIHNLEHLLSVEQDAIADGYEGLILRCPNAPYKFGRSTVNQGYLLKLKRFRDAEATVIGFEERLHNGNEAKADELGYTSRSSHKANLVPLGDLGALVCDYQGQTVKIGTGFTATERLEIWQERQAYVGQMVKFKFFDYGIKEAPRHPVFLGWRDAIDA